MPPNVLPSTTRSMGWVFLDRLIILVHTSDHPTDDHWERYLAELRAQPDVFELRVLVYSAGGGPSARQRSDLFQVANARRRAWVAIVTPSRVMRGIGTALAWMLPQVRMFAPARFDDALDYLELDAIERHEAVVALGALCRAVGVEVARDPQKDV